MKKDKFSKGLFVMVVMLILWVRILITNKLKKLTLIISENLYLEAREKQNSEKCKFKYFIINLNFIAPIVLKKLSVCGDN